MASESNTSSQDEEILRAIALEAMGDTAFLDDDNDNDNDKEVQEVVQAKAVVDATDTTSASDTAGAPGTSTSTEPATSVEGKKEEKTEEGELSSEDGIIGGFSLEDGCEGLKKGCEERFVKVSTYPSTTTDTASRSTLKYMHLALVKACRE